MNETYTFILKQFFMKKNPFLLSVIGLLTVSMLLPASLSAMRVQGDDPTLIVILPPATSPELGLGDFL